MKIARIALGVIAALVLIYFWPRAGKDADVVVLGFPAQNVAFDNPTRVVTHFNGVDFISDEGRQVHFVGTYRVEYPAPKK
jgi:hypothetical protein